MKLRVPVVTALFVIVAAGMVALASTVPAPPPAGEIRAASPVAEAADGSAALTQDPFLGLSTLERDKPGPGQKCTACPGNDCASGENDYFCCGGPSGDCGACRVCNGNAGCWQGPCIYP